jgi:hypothetical protein
MHPPGEPRAPGARGAPLPTYRKYEHVGSRHQMVGVQVDMKVVWRSLRWLGFVMTLGILMGGLLFGWFESCADAISGEKIVKICAPPTVTDARIIVLFFIAVLLLLPDMGEIGVFGLSLKRRLEDAEKKTEQIETRMLFQENKIDTVAQSVSSAQANVGPILIGDAAISQAQSKFEEKGRALLEEPSEHSHMTITTGPSEDLDAGSLVKLMRNWEEISSVLRIGIHGFNRRFSDQSQYTSAQIHFIESFGNTFSEELQMVRAARNSGVHFAYISNEELDKAADLSDGLNMLLKNGLEVHGRRQEDKQSGQQES